MKCKLMHHEIKFIGKTHDVSKNNKFIPGHIVGFKEGYVFGGVRHIVVDNKVWSI